MAAPLKPSGGQPARVQLARAFTLLITNMIKLSGLTVALDELLVRPTARTAALALAGFMMSGAQFSENAILRIIDRLLGVPDAPVGERER